MKTGIFGGTFNPVHLGHLRLAEEVRELLALEKVIFIPSAIPPHKKNSHIIPFEKRYKMLEIAIKGNNFFFLSDIEGKRGGKSYTVDTLSVLEKEYPSSDFYLFIGYDNLLEFSEWKDFKILFEKVNLVVLPRPFVIYKKLREILPVDVMKDFCYKTSEKCYQHKSGKKIIFLKTTLIDFSSTDIRRRLKKGLSVRYMVPDELEHYITRKGLYGKNYKF